MTRWAGSVSPLNVLPDYPRPQLVRERWLNLNGLWELAFARPGEPPPFGRRLPHDILVPFAIESALSGLKMKADRVWYRRTFDVPRTWSDSRILLHFGAVDWEACVYVNGHAIGEHRGGFDGFTFDITDFLSASGPQELVVGVFDPTDAGEQPRGKQVRAPGGIWYTSVTGIWQTVWLEPVPAASIRELRLVPDVDAATLRVTARIVGSPSGATLRAVASAEGETTGTVEGGADATLSLEIEDPQLWSPASPFLYDLEVSLLDGGETVDRVSSYFGVREVAIAEAADGNKRLMVNGETVPPMTVLDQGYWPDGLYTAPTDEALRYDAELAGKLGFAMLRKHGKVEPERWYYWCDRLGLLVWQEMPGAGQLLSLDGMTLYDKSHIERPRDPDSARQFEKELERLIRGRGNHPSIAAWIVFNSGWGQYDTVRIMDRVRDLDPTRPVTTVAGWNLLNRQGGVVDQYQYPGPGGREHAQSPGGQGRPLFAELGALGMVVDGHTWSEDVWARPSTAWDRELAGTREELTRRYVELAGWIWGRWLWGGQLAGWRDASWRPDGLAHVAVFYTQLTDVESEISGLVTYDREVIKIEVGRVAAANRGDFRSAR